MRNVSESVRKDHLDRWAVSILLLCCLFWGFQQVMVKATIPEVPSVLQAGIRFMGASVLVWLWCRWRGVRLFPSPLPADPSFAPGVLAGLLFFGEFACLQLGLLHIPASRLTVFLYTSPFWVAAIVPWVVRSERLTVWQWSGLGLAFVSVLVSVAQGAAAGAASSFWGDLLALGAGACWGLTTVVIRTTALGRAGAERILFYQVAVSGPLLLLMSFVLGEAWPRHWSGFAILSLLLQAGLGAFGSFLVWMWMLGRYPATRLSSFVFLTPVFALVFGAMWLGEPITWSLIMALVGVAMGIVLVNKR